MRHLIPGRCRRGKRRALLCMLAVAGGLGIVLVLARVFLNHVTMCGQDESKRILEKLCMDYHNAMVSGNLCPDLCLLHNIKFVKCLNFRGGKQVFLAKHRDNDVIMKAKVADIRDTNLIYYINDATGEATYPSVADFVKLVSESAKFNLDVEVALSGEDLVRQLWPVDVIEYIRLSQADALKHAAMQSLWSLLEQDEYLMLRYMYIYKRESHHFPKMYGTCGHFYFLESTPTHTIMDMSVSKLVGLDSPPWRDRVRLALGLLDLLGDLKTQFVEELHLCDIKGMNFGVGRNGTLKLIDVDTVFFETKMRTEMQSQEGNHCSKHTDCDFFDCQGWCDTQLGKCLSLRLNNNFQVVCQKIFGSHSTNMYSGLLSRPPVDIAPEVRAVLESCANPPVPETVDLPGCTSFPAGGIHCPDLVKYERSFMASEEDFRKLSTLLQKKDLIQQ